MAVVSQAPAVLDLVGVKGDDFSVTVTVTENSVAYDWLGATVSTSIVDQSGTAVATNFTSATSAGGILTLSLTDANTTTLGVGSYRYWLSVTKSSATRTWLAGLLTVMENGWGGSSSSSASLSITNGNVTVSTTTLVAANATSININDSNGYYTSSTVEGALAELGPNLIAPTKIWSHSKTWDAASGAPVYSATALGVAGHRHGGALFDGSTLETMYFFMPLPIVNNFDLYLAWANPSATSGDVVWQAQYEFMTPGQTLDSFITGNQITVTSPATNVVTETRLLSGIARGTATSVGIKLLRRGDVAADTVNAVDVAAIAVRLEAAS